MISEMIKDLSLVYAPLVKHDLEMILFRVEMIRIWATHPEQIEEINKLKAELAKQIKDINSKIKEEKAS